MALTCRSKTAERDKSVDLLGITGYNKANFSTDRFNPLRLNISINIQKIFRTPVLLAKDNIKLIVTKIYHQIVSVNCVQ